MPGPWTFNILHIGEGLNLGYPTLIWHISHSFTTVPPLLRAVAILSVTGNPPDIHPLHIPPDNILCIDQRCARTFAFKAEVPPPLMQHGHAVCKYWKDMRYSTSLLRTMACRSGRTCSPETCPEVQSPWTGYLPAAPPLCHSLWQPSKLVAITTGCGHQLHTLFTTQGFQSSKVPTTVV